MSMSSTVEQPPNSPHLPYSTADQEPRHLEYNMRFKIKAQELLRSIRPAQSKFSVLDFGCGRGEFLQMLHDDGFSCTGVDFDPVCVELSSRYATCYKAGSEDVREVMAGQQFDCVTALHVLEHLDNPRQAVEDLKTLSRRWFIFAVPNLAIPTALCRRHIKAVNAGHAGGWDPGHFQAFLENRCGLRIVRWIPDQVILPSVSRLAERFKVRRWLENVWLPKRFPFLSTSLITLCEKAP